MKTKVTIQTEEVWRSIIIDVPREKVNDAITQVTGDVDAGMTVSLIGYDETLIIPRDVLRAAIINLEDVEE